MNQKTKPASALIFTLIILFIGVVSAIGIASATLISRKMSTTSGKSVASFQIADSGAEIILQKMKDTLDSDSNAKITDMGITCSNGTVSGNISSGKEYEITFLDENGNQLPAGCSAQISDVQKIRSIGTYAQISRAIEAAVAAGGGEGTTGGCHYANNDSATWVVQGNWGSGCKSLGTNVSHDWCESASASGYNCGATSLQYFPSDTAKYWRIFCVCIKS